MSSNITTNWLNPGDNAWQLTAGSLVALQSIPGLAILYAGWVREEWVINSAFMVFYSFAAVFVSWVLWAYKMGFGEWLTPFVGTPGPIMTIDYELSQAILPASGVTAQFPISTMAYFQFVFAAITVIIMSGAFLCRIRFLVWAIFVPLWLTFSYTVGAFSLWGGGFLTKLGVIDYSGGYVIHLSSGTAGYVGAWWIGPRLQKHRDSFPPHNVALMLIGAGVIWIGWNGFNGGDPYAASADAGVAVLNTNIATAVSVLVWIALDCIKDVEHKMSVIGAIQGMLSGLVAITPAAGVVNGWGAVIIGVLAGSIPWLSMNFGKKLEQVDDVLQVFDTHAVAGVVGGICVGLFATKDGCTAFGLTIPGGAIEGNWRQLGIQIVGAVFIFLLNIIVTSAIFGVLTLVFRYFGMKLRYEDETLVDGDDAICSERLYVKTAPQEDQELSERANGALGPTSSPTQGSPVDEFPAERV